jgi:hypothetical protein
MHTDAYGSMWVHMQAIFIDFRQFALISAGFDAIWGQGIGRPVAGCGG